eukprot:4463516-Pyramimonas_sp.AAC.2
MNVSAKFGARTIQRVGRGGARGRFKFPTFVCLVRVVRRAPNPSHPRSLRTSPHQCLVLIIMQLVRVNKQQIGSNARVVGVHPWVET